MPTTAIPIRASTQEHLDIEDVQDDFVILKTGGCAIIIQVTAINFDLLSEGEQDAIIYAYAGLLNSLTFPIQIMIRSNIKDVSDYLRLLLAQEQKQRKPLLLDQLKKYRQFVETIVRDNHVLDKKFYVVVPFSPVELGLTSTALLSGQKKKGLPFPKHYILERAKMSLLPKRDHLFRQFGRLGLQSRQLNTQQLLELFYNTYNQESVGQRLVSSTDYATPIVQPAIGQTNTIPTPNPFQTVTVEPKPVVSPSFLQQKSIPQRPGTPAPIPPTPPTTPVQPKVIPPSPMTQPPKPDTTVSQPPQQTTTTQLPSLADTEFGYDQFEG